ncbi:MAG: hypothetical protein U5O39_03925 [Gammaproteobacteria bacterium]|nr:hypothetical protein [Gammaproteobacteria bacterium]
MASTGIAVTYGELEDRLEPGSCTCFANGPAVGPAPASPCCLPNGPDYLKIVWAAQRAGLYYTPDLRPCSSRPKSTTSWTIAMPASCVTTAELSRPREPGGARRPRRLPH